MSDGWEAPNWPQGLVDLKYILDQSHKIEGQNQKPYRLQPMAWHSQAKTGHSLIRSISQLRRHLPEGFTRCSPAFYSPSTIIELTELLYQQPGPEGVMEAATMARNLRQILGLSDPSALDCSLVNTMRRGAPSKVRKRNVL